MQNTEKQYMLDTCAINCLCDNKNDLLSLICSQDAGYKYYITNIQWDEIENTINPKGSNSAEDTVQRIRAERALQLSKTVGCIRPYTKRHFLNLFGNYRLDGSCDFVPSGTDDAWEMYLDIRGCDDESKYENDAMIALTAIVNHHALVTADKRLYKKVALHFPLKAKWYPDFISGLPDKFCSTKQK